MADQLRPYQVEGTVWLSQRKRALLADEMRLGKSAQAIRAACALTPVWMDVAPKIAVICPASVVPVWHGQFDKWWQFGKPHLNVVSYDEATRGALDGETFDVLILDEVHYLKSKDAQRTKKIYGARCDGVGGLIAKANRVYALSGTPMPNHPGELWPTLRALAPEAITKNGAPMNYWSYVNNYCKTIDNGFGLQIVGGKNLDKLKASLGGFMLRRRYSEVAGNMLPLQFDTLPVAGTVPDEGELADILKGCKTDDEILLRLAQKKTHTATVRRLTGLAKVAGILAWYRGWRDSGGGKVVFMAYHRDVIEKLHTGLLGIGGAGSAVKLEGSMAQHERAASVRDFREKEQCASFVGQLAAAGTGIDLSKSDTLVFVESDWVPGNNAQAAMRIQQVGSTTLKQVWLATFRGSLDEKIQGASARKLSDSLQVFG